MSMHDDFWNDWPATVRTLFERILRPENQGRIIALDFDNTCIQGDVGALFHFYLSRHFAWDLDNVVQQVAPEDGQQHLQELVALWRHDNTHARALFEELMLTFPRRLARTGVAETYGWAATLYGGLTVSELQRHVRHMLTEERAHPSETETVTCADGTALAITRGVHSRPAMAALIQAGARYGVDTYVVSATTEAVVEVAAQDFGVPAHRVLGNRGRIRDGVITVERDGPIMVGQGKVDALHAAIGAIVRPLLAIGDSHTDAALLHHAEHAILIDRGDAALRDEAERAGWAIVLPSDLRTVPWGRLSGPLSTAC